MRSYCVLHGRLTADPTLRYTASNTPVCSFRLAVDSGYGENKQTLFIGCTAWKATAEVVSRNFTKGSEILVFGELVPNNWTTKDGENRYEIKMSVQSIDFCGSKSDSAAVSDMEDMEEVDDKDLPF